MNVETVEMQKGTGQGPPFGTGWTCGGSHFARSCPKGKSKGQNGPAKAKKSARAKGSRLVRCSSLALLAAANTFRASVRQAITSKMPAKTVARRRRATAAAGTARRSAPHQLERRSTTRRKRTNGDVENVSEGWDILGLEEGRRQQRRHHWHGCSRRCWAARNRFEALQ